MTGQGRFGLALVAALFWYTSPAQAYQCGCSGYGGACGSHASAAEACQAYAAGSVFTYMGLIPISNDGTTADWWCSLYRESNGNWYNSYEHATCYPATDCDGLDLDGACITCTGEDTWDPDTHQCVGPPTCTAYPPASHKKGGFLAGEATSTLCIDNCQFLTDGVMITLADGSWWGDWISDGEYCAGTDDPPDIPELPEGCAHDESGNVLCGGGTQPTDCGTYNGVLVCTGIDPASNCGYINGQLVCADNATNCGNINGKTVCIQPPEFGQFGPQNSAPDGCFVDSTGRQVCVNDDKRETTTTSSTTDGEGNTTTTSTTTTNTSNSSSTTTTYTTVTGTTTITQSTSGDSQDEGDPDGAGLIEGVTEDGGSGDALDGLLEAFGSGDPMYGHTPDGGASILDDWTLNTGLTCVAPVLSGCNRKCHCLV